MKERRNVKIRVDMYDDTKFKIIDTKPERDLIHYIWTRTLTLAGKVNLDGELHLSKNIPYTEETLAIEFNRDIMSVRLAFKVFMELEMIEITNDNVYKVKNFSKYQDSCRNSNKNIKENILKKNLNQESEEAINGVEEKILKKELMEESKVAINVVEEKETVLDEPNNNLDVKIDEMLKMKNHEIKPKAYANEDKKSDNKTILKQVCDNVTEKSEKIYSKDKKDRVNSKLFQLNKPKKKNTRKKKKVIDGIAMKEEKEDYLIEIYDGEKPLAEGEVLVKSFDFS